MLSDEQIAKVATWLGFKHIDSDHGRRLEQWVVPGHTNILSWNLRDFFLIGGAEGFIVEKLIGHGSFYVHDVDGLVHARVFAKGESLGTGKDDNCKTIAAALTLAVYRALESGALK